MFGCATLVCSFFLPSGSARILKHIDPSFARANDVAVDASAASSSTDDAAADDNGSDTVSLHPNIVHRRALFFSGIGRIGSPCARRNKGALSATS